MSTSRSAIDGFSPLRVEMRDFIARRTRLGLAIIIIAIPLFGVIDFLAGSEPFGWLCAVKVCALVLTAFGYVALKRPRNASRATVIALLALGVNSGASALHGILIGEFLVATVLCVSMAFASGMLLPWGACAQLGAAVVVATAVATNFYWVHGGPLTHRFYASALAVLIGMAVSVLIAYELRRHWVRLLEEREERKRVEVEVRSLNEKLEERVRERTAELESANRTLEAEVGQHVQTANALRQNQQQLQEIVDNSTAVIYVKDVEGHYLLVNSWWESLFGVSREELPGNTDYDLFPAETAAAFRANDRQVLQANQPLHFEEVVRYDDGPHVYVSVKFPMRDGDGFPRGVCGISTDITALKRAEDRTRQHQAELAHVLRLHSMGEIVAGLAHEINQPLGAIANYANGCRQRIRSLDVDLADLGRRLDQISSEAVRAGEIIRRFRPLVRKEPPRDEVVDINAVVSDAARVVESQIKLSGMTLQIVATPGRLKVRGDGIQLEQVVVNLLLNGIEAMASLPREGRELSVRTSAVNCTAVQVSVCDSGVGLLPATADNVFDPFFTTKPDGLGMGLAISRTIIEAHAGRLWATSNPDRGSTFHFTLPLWQDAEAPAAGRSDAGGPAGGLVTNPGRF